MKEQQDVKIRKYVKSLGMLAVLAGLTFYLFLKDNNLGELAEAVRGARPGYLFLGVSMMGLFLFFEALTIKWTMDSLGQRSSVGKCLKYSVVGFYFSAITPSASGGQPMQMYYMKKDGINLSISSLTMLIIIVIYQAISLLYGGVMFAMRPEFLMNSGMPMKLLMVYGVAANVVLIGLVMAAIFSKHFVHRFTLWAVRILARLHVIKDAASACERAEEQISEYKQGAAHIKKHPAVLMRVAVATVLQLTAQYIVPFFVYKAFGLSTYGALDMLAVQALLTIAVSSLPLPGAVGASESGFMMMNRLFFGQIFLLPAMLLSRGISFYAVLLICGVTLAAVQIKESTSERILPAKVSSVTKAKIAA